MTTITVYVFTIYNPKNGVNERAKGMATEETIAQIKDATIIKSEFKQIDDSELTQSNRYHEPVQEESK